MAGQLRDTNDSFDTRLSDLADNQETLKNQITLAYQIAPLTGNDNALAAFAMLKWRSTKLVRSTLETNHRNAYNHTIATNNCEKRAIARAVGVLKSAFNKSDETTSDQSKQCTHEMLSHFAQDTEKALYILQTYKLKIINLEKQHDITKIDKEKTEITDEITYTQKLCEILQGDLHTLPTRRSLVTNTMSRKGVLERFAHMESHNNMCKDMIREGNKVENDRFVNMTNASFDILQDYLGDTLAIMGSIALDIPNGVEKGIQRDVAMHACPLLCVVPLQATIDDIYQIIKRLHGPYDVDVSEMASHFDDTDGMGINTAVSSSSGYPTPNPGATPNQGATPSASPARY